METRELRYFVANVSSFRRRRVVLPDGTYGYRVVRPEWESILTSLRRDRRVMASS